MTDEEKLQIKYYIDDKIEKILLQLPDVMSALWEQEMARQKANSEFYGAHKEFLNHLDIVKSVVDEVDDNNPGIGYAKVLEKATPLIESRIKTILTADLKTVERPKDLTFNNGEL